MLTTGTQVPGFYLMLREWFSLSLSLFFFFFFSVENPSFEVWLKTTNQLIAALHSAHRTQSEGELPVRKLSQTEPCVLMLINACVTGAAEEAEPVVPQGFRVDFTPQ